MIDDPSMTEEEIVKTLRDQADAAQSFYNSDLADRQANALDFYDNQLFGDEEDGLSAYVEPVVEQTIDDMVVDIMEAFVSGDRVVEFEANDEDQEQAASEATEVIHYLFMRKQSGYRVTLDWLQSGLVEILGVVKTCAIEEKKRKKDMQIIPNDALGLLDESQVTAASDNGDGTHTVELTIDSIVKRYSTMPIPSEEFIFGGGMKSLDDKVYKAHVTIKTLSDLVEMGFDRDIVDQLTTEQVSAGNMMLGDQRENARWRDTNWQYNIKHGVNRQVKLYEEYDYLDIDGDGISELVKAFRVDNVLLSVEPCDEQPFVGFCPYPRAHRLYGKALSEKVMPDQRVESVITRQMLDGLYASNTPRRWLPDESTGDNTIDDLLNGRAGTVVRGKGLTAPVNMSENFDLSKSLTVLERFSQRRQSRTGLLDLGKGMDKDALNSTASGQKQLAVAGEKQIRYVARNFGEAMAEMFMKLMRLVRNHGEPMMIKIGKKYQLIDPSKWPEEMDFSIRVGLGTNGKEQRIAHRMAVTQMQAEAYQAGTGLVTPQHLYNSADGIIRDMGIGEPSDYFADPESPEFQAPEQQQDPAMAKVKGDQSMQEMKLQTDQVMTQQKMELARQEAELKLQLLQQQAQGEAELARDKAEFEAQQATARMEQEFQLSQQRMAMEAQMASHKAGLAEQASLSKNRPGGDLDK